MLRRIASLILVLLVAAAPAAADSIHDRKRGIDARIARLRAEAAEAHRREASLQAEVAAVSDDIRSLERRAGDVSLGLATLERDLALYQRRLAALNALYRVQDRRLRLLRREHGAAVERLNRRLVEIYEADEVDPLEIILGSASFSDALDGLEYMRRIAEQDKRIAGEVAAAKRDAVRARARTERLRARVEGSARAIAVRTSQVRRLRDQLVANRDAMAAAQARQRRALTSLRDEERAAAEEIDALQAVSAQLAAQIQAAQQQQQPSTSSSDTDGGFGWPVAGTVTSPFGWRWGRMHEGIDIAAPQGVPIAAAGSGRVIIAGWVGGYGNLVVIDHGGGIATAYGHQSSIAVAVGQQLARGQTIGLVGSTGNSTGPHVHFEVRVNGAPADPLGYL